MNAFHRVSAHGASTIAGPGGVSGGAAEMSTSALPFLLNDYVGYTYLGKPIIGHDEVIQHIDSGTTITAHNGVITYSFLDGPHTIGQYNNPHQGFSEPGGYSPMSPEEQAVARESMQLWDDLIAPSIVEKNGNGADIVFANTTTGPAQGWTYYPNEHQYKHIGSDVWTADPTVNWTNEWLNPSGYGWDTIVHESGHALGLSHPGAYNFGPGFAVTYENGAEYAQDSRQYSIMSYWDPYSNTGAQTIDAAVGLYNYPQTPMIDDILTIQAKYGADLTTRVGDTVYGFNSNAGDALYDFSQNMAPNLAIYDAGGNDTIDMSGANASVFLDLRPGAFSSAATLPTLDQANAATEQFNAATDDATQGNFAFWGQADYDAWIDYLEQGIVAPNVEATTGVTGINALSFENVSIAYNTIIENAIGGSMRDYLVGNDVANQLTGNGGDDILWGLGGDDTLIGGTGNDTFKFSNDGSTDTINDFQTGHDVIDLSEVAGATAANVAYDSTTHQLQIDTNGDSSYDMFVHVLGSGVATSDILFHA